MGVEGFILDERLRIFAIAIESLCCSLSLRRHFDCLPGCTRAYLWEFAQVLCGIDADMAESLRILGMQTFNGNQE